MGDAEISLTDRRILALWFLVGIDGAGLVRELFQYDVARFRRAAMPAPARRLAAVDGRSQALAGQFMHVAEARMIGIPGGLQQIVIFKRRLFGKNDDKAGFLIGSENVDHF